MQLEGKLAELQQEALRRLTELRKAKGCKPREIGGHIVIQKAVETRLEKAQTRGFKEDLRVYVCCSISVPHRVFVYRRMGLRRAPAALAAAALGKHLDNAAQCTHYGHITPVSSAEDWPAYPLMFPQICRAVGSIMKVVTPVLEERCTVLLGMDFICDEQRPYLLEINQVPRLCYEDPQVQAWTEGMAIDFLRLVVLHETLGSRSAWLPV